MNDTSNQKTHFNTQLGATFKTKHIDREVNIYPMTEAELESISLINTVSSLSFSISSYFFCQLIEKTELWFESKPSIGFPWNTLIIVVAPLFLACLSLFKRRAIIKKLKEKSS